MKKIVITGAAGFIGSNLRARLGELQYDVLEITRNTSAAQFDARVLSADFIFHLAGVNRPKDDGDFAGVNVGLTERLCATLAKNQRQIPIAYTSSTQATLGNPYGLSKRAAEGALCRYSEETGAAIYLCRLPNVFGKWCRPDYNSAVATFCYRLARGIPITIHDPSAPLRLLYVDDAINAFIALLTGPTTVGTKYVEIGPIYETSVGELAQMLESIAASRKSLLMPQVGSGFLRALYSTYTSYLPPESFQYQVPCHSDQRGVFVEMLRTAESGQFSYFVAKAGVTRGEHYHHSKAEKFLVIQGTARFQFRDIRTDRFYEVTVRGGEGHIVETTPGWTHNVTNIGTDELIVMLWASELFDRARPDTIPCKVEPMAE